MTNTGAPGEVCVQLLYSFEATNLTARQTNTLDLLLSSNAFDWQQREVLAEAWALAEQSRLELMSGWRASKAQIWSPQNDTMAKTQLATERCVEDYYVAKAEWANRMDAWARERVRRMEQERLQPVHIVVDDPPPPTLEVADEEYATSEDDRSPSGSESPARLLPDAKRKNAFADEMAHNNKRHQLSPVTAPSSPVDEEPAAAKSEPPSRRPTPAASALHVIQITTPASSVNGEEQGADAVPEAAAVAAATSAATVSTAVEVSPENPGPVPSTPRAASMMPEAEASERDATANRFGPLSAYYSSPETSPRSSPSPTRSSVFEEEAATADTVEKHNTNLDSAASWVTPASTPVPVSAVDGMVENAFKRAIERAFERVVEKIAEKEATSTTAPEAEAPSVNHGHVVALGASIETPSSSASHDEEAKLETTSPNPTPSAAATTEPPAPASKKVSLVIPKQKNTKNLRSEWLSNERAKKVAAQFALRP